MRTFLAPFGEKVCIYFTVSYIGHPFNYISLCFIPVGGNGVPIQKIFSLVLHKCRSGSGEKWDSNQAKPVCHVSSSLFAAAAVELSGWNCCDSLWKTMNRPKPILIARKLCWMVKKFRLIYLTQLDRKTTLLSETITSAVEKDFFVSSQLQTWNRFSQLQSSGGNTVAFFSQFLCLHHH